MPRAKGEWAAKPAHEVAQGGLGSGKPLWGRRDHQRSRIAVCASAWMSCSADDILEQYDVFHSALHGRVHRAQMWSACPVHLADLLPRGDHFAVDHFVHWVQGGAAPLDVRGRGRKVSTWPSVPSLFADLIVELDGVVGVVERRHHAVMKAYTAYPTKLGQVLGEMRNEGTPPSPCGTRRRKFREI